MIIAIRIRSELPSQVIRGLVLRVLEIVFPVRGSLPDVNDCVGDSLAGQEIGHLAVHECGMSAGRGVLDDRAARLAERCVGRPEGSEDGGGGGVVAIFGHDFVGDFIDESADCLLESIFFEMHWK